MRCSSACGKTGLTVSLAVFCGSSQETMHNQSPSRFVILQHEPSASYLNRVKMQRREEECVRADAAGGAACAARRLQTDQTFQRPDLITRPAVCVCVCVCVF